MANEKTPVVWDDTAKKHRPLGSGEKMGGLSASSMISSDSGNLLQQGSDGLMLVTGSSLADPRADNLLEESDNGKLQVTSDRVVEWLEGHPQAAAAIAEAVKVVSGDSGNVIVAGTDKGAFMSKNTLAGAVSTMSAAQLTTLANALRAQGGGLSVGSDGKLSVDFASMDPAIMRSVVLSMVQQGGGIAVDQSGKLYVDFSSMPTDKFEELLSSLKMQVPLESSLSLYVNNQSPNAGDDIVDGRGTAAKPFRTVQACVSWAASYYALGPYHITVYVHPGSPYDGPVTLPAFSATTGVFRIRTDDANGERPILRCSGGVDTNVNAIGGSWYLYDLNLVNNPSDPDDGRPHYPYCVRSYSGARVSIQGCTLEMSYYGAASANVRPTVVAAESGGFVDFRPNVRKTIIKYHKGDAAALTVLGAGGGGSVSFYGTWGDEETAIDCQGDATFFASAGTGGSMQPIGSGSSHMHFVVASGQTCTGYRYSITEGSSIFATTGGFPGSSDSGNEVESATYSWYKQQGV